MEYVLVGLFLTAVVLVVLYGPNRNDFVLRCRDGRFTCRGQLARRAELEQFLQDDLGLAGPLEIAGRRRSGRLVLSFGGELTQGQRQRIRNFLLTRQ